MVEGLITARIGLRGRLMLLVVAVVTTVMLISSAMFVVQLSNNLTASMRGKSDALLESLSSKGVSVARNVALTSERAIAVGNFSFLPEVIKTVVDNDHEFLYGIIMDRDRQAMVHSDPQRAGHKLDEPQDLQAAKAENVTTQNVPLPGGGVALEVVAPLMVEGTRWGWVRFGLSTARVRNEIAVSEEAMRLQIFRVVTTSLGIALVLGLASVLFGVVTASTLVNPLKALLQTVKRVREGDLEALVTVDGAPEFHALAQGFNEMMMAVKSREAALSQALSEAEQVNRLKSEFLANVSHELRTPLNAIINFPTAMLRDYHTRLLWSCETCASCYEPDTAAAIDEQAPQEVCPECNAPMRLRSFAKMQGSVDDHYTFINRTISAGKHLLAVVTDILDLSKLESGKMVLHPEEVNVGLLLRELTDTLAVLAESKRIKLKVADMPPGTTVWVDKLKFSQVVINLVGNAIKFTRETGVVEVLLHREDPKFAHFEVRDSGIGIPSDKLEVIFESFRQVDGSHTRAHGGTGLGLAICRKLVDLQGGKIWAESTLGRGSSFFFTVPWPPHVAEAAGTEQTAEATGQRFTGRVVVIDDDRDSCELVERILTEAGHEVTAVLEPGLLPQAINLKPVSLFILDIMMPGTNGLVLLRQLRSNDATAAVPVIVSSAYHSNRSLVESLGATWLPKPWGSEELKVAAATEIKRLARRGEGN